MGSMYIAVLFIGITNATAVQPVVSVERFVSYRERAAGMYSALPFAFAQVGFYRPNNNNINLYKTLSKLFLCFICRVQLSFHMC